jgi:eukaryotic-like serine/threonine-protein kinase
MGGGSAASSEEAAREPPIFKRVSPPSSRCSVAAGEAGRITYDIQRMAEENDREAPPPFEAEDATTRLAERPPRSSVPRICSACGEAPVTPDVPCAHCGAVQGADAKMLVVDKRYQVESVVGRGGMGIVYLAEDTGLGRHVALKMIAPRWLGDGAIASSFHREARALASIRNQYVVQVYASGFHEGSYFFAMEYVRGRTLRQILVEHRKHGETLPLQRTLTIVHRIAQGIDSVHAAGIVHRDVKPSNIVIEEDTGRPVLVDFGLAVPTTDPAAALAIGTPQYMAPEQAGVGVAGATVTARTDVYSLGIVAYEMLAGQLPFDSTDLAQLVRHHARRRPPELSSIRRDLAPFDKVVERALAKDPEKRYPTCTAFAEVLAAAGERWVTSTLPTLPPPSPEPMLIEAALPAGLRSTGDLTSPPLPAPDSLSQSIEGAVAAATPRKPASDRTLYALVVDDSQIFRRFAVQATQLALFRHNKGLRVVVHGAASGHEAIEVAASHPPDLVLLDFDMPGLDGADTLSRLRALPGGSRARVVVVSGRVGAKDRWRFAVHGVNDFVAKPIDFRQLVDRIETIAKRIEETGRVLQG